MRQTYTERGNVKGALSAGTARGSARVNYISAARVKFLRQCVHFTKDRHAATIIETNSIDILIQSDYQSRKIVFLDGSEPVQATSSICPLSEININHSLQRFWENEEVV